MLVVGVSSAAAFNSGLKKDWVKKEKKTKREKALCLVQCVCTEVKSFFFCFSKKE